jgi:hypothetical protein
MPEVATDEDSTLVFPFAMEMLRLVDSLGARLDIGQELPGW